MKITMMRTVLFFLLVVLYAGCKKNETTEEALPAVSSIKFENTGASIVLGKPAEIKISHFPSNAAKPEYEFSTSNSSILVPADGLLFGRALGSATITAKVKGTNISTTYTFNIVPDVILIITFDKKQIKLSVGEQAKITPEILPIGASGAAVKWSSSNPAVAQVTSAGVVTALSAGNAVITLASEDGGVSATSNIEVPQDVLYSSAIFTKLKSDLLNDFILYNEQQGDALALELKAGRAGYIVLAESATEVKNITTNPGYVIAKFSNLVMPAGDVRKIQSSFFLEYFPNNSRQGIMMLSINFLDKVWEVKSTYTKTYTFKYSDDVTLAMLKAIVDESVVGVRKYVNGN